MFRKAPEFHTQAPEGLTAAEPKGSNFQTQDSLESVATVSTDASAE